MNTAELQHLIEQGRVELLDVRTEMEFRSGHIAGAKHIPVEELVTMASYQAPEAGRQLCLICQSGKRAERARQHLESSCGVAACVLEHGMNAWEQAGLPVEKSAGARLPLIRQIQIIVGLVNLVTLAFGYWVSPLWLIVPAFTSCGLLFAGVTGICGLALVLSRMPWNRG